MDKALRLELKTSIGENEYVFSMPYGASYGEVYDAAHAVLMHLAQEAQQAAEQAQRQEDNTDVKEEDGSK